jgi:urease accessory protein UreE
MALQQRNRIRGRIVVVQESRFRMVTDRGQELLFTLSHRSPVSDRDLHHWKNSSVHVVVEYEEEPNLESGIAHLVQPLG